LFQRVLNRRISVKQIELTPRDTLGRQSVETIIHAVIEEKLQANEDIDLTGGSAREMSAQEDRELSQTAESITGPKGVPFLHIVLVLIICGISFVLYRIKKNN